jgi:hypothetical protein
MYTLGDMSGEIELWDCTGSWQATIFYSHGILGACEISNKAGHSTQDQEIILDFLFQQPVIQYTHRPAEPVDLPVARIRPQKLAEPVSQDQNNGEKQPNGTPFSASREKDSPASATPLPQMSRGTHPPHLQLSWKPKRTQLGETAKYINRADLPGIAWRVLVLCDGGKSIADIITFLCGKNPSQYKLLEIQAALCQLVRDNLLSNT